MGTNYYFAVKSKAAIHKLVNNDEINLIGGLHVGKSSAGWRFIFRAYDEYDTLEGLKEFYTSHSDIFELRNEYGDVIYFDEFLVGVDSKKDGQYGAHCELHEDGTVWYEGEFS